MTKELKHGFTTGSCAAAAAKAATYMLLSGNIKDRITIDTPKGISFDAEILDISMEEERVRCAVRKDGGDDPDITTGLLVYAEVRRGDGKAPSVTIEGGEGVGIVTKPGLDQPVGNSAINSVPRLMIEKEVTEVVELWEPETPISVIISIPGGEEVAKKTFNPRLGIEGGISVIGTTGVVEPMSVEALIDTIKVELNQRKALGDRCISITPGSYGLNFMKKEYGFDLDKSVKCSNYIGAACDHVAKLGFEKMLLTGHAGKLVKIAGGIMNTHSREADSRMEIIAASALRKGAKEETLKRVLEANTTEEAFGILNEVNLTKEVSEDLIEKILFYLDRRLGGEVEVECIIFINEMGLLGASSGAKDLIEELKAEWQ